MAGVSSAAAGTPSDRLFSILSDLRAAYNVELCKFNLAGPELLELVNRDIGDISDDIRNDETLLKLMIIRADVNGTFPDTFKSLVEQKIFEDCALFYECYAMYHITEGNLLKANTMYKEGIKRNALPLEYLEGSYAQFLKHLGRIAQPKRFINPYSPQLVEHLSKKLVKVQDSCATTLKKISVKSKIRLGGEDYHIKEISGEGQHAHVYTAYINNDAERTVALKVEKKGPVLGAWEFYMYTQLRKRIHGIKRPKFGDARKLYTCKDTSILVCDHLSNGTLQDVINFYTFGEISMDEVLCMYYTVEMLDMLEVLHGNGIIHGDFNPDNLLLRLASDDLTDLTEDGFKDRTKVWRDEGLCLIDWGMGIDVNLFPYCTEFTGYSETVDFRCTEMQANKPWKYQTDSYGLCRVVHLMIHGKTMDDALDKISDGDGGSCYRPKATYKSGWNAELWDKLFSTLLNIGSSRNDQMLLRSLKRSFEDYIWSDTKLIMELASQPALVRALVPKIKEKEKASLTLKLMKRYKGIQDDMGKKTYRDVIADFKENIFKPLKEAYPDVLILIPVEDEVFGTKLETIQINLEDIKCVVEYDELHLQPILVYQCYLYKKTKSKYPDKSFQFTNTSGCDLKNLCKKRHVFKKSHEEIADRHECSKSYEEIAHHLQRAIPGSFTFFIFNPWRHWFVLACVDQNFYVIDSLNLDANKVMKYLMTEAVDYLNDLNKNGQQLNPKWIELESPHQPDGTCCGHYSLQNLKVILDSDNPIERIQAIESYPSEVIDQVRAELLDFLTQFIICHISGLLNQDM